MSARVYHLASALLVVGPTGATRTVYDQYRDGLTTTEMAQSLRWMADEIERSGGEVEAIAADLPARLALAERTIERIGSEIESTDAEPLGAIIQEYEAGRARLAK